MALMKMKWGSLKRAAISPESKEDAMSREPKYAMRDSDPKREAPL
jgi:hypothetical protein